MAIPIENIYYLLSYAWNRLDESERVRVAIDDRTELLDLFAKILVNATRILIKRGINKNYVEICAEISGVKGKLQLTETVKKLSLQRSKTVCLFDEYSADILMNQILVTTIWRLVRTKDLDRELKGELKSLLVMLGNVSRIELKGSDFSQVKLNRNNRFYGFVLDVCRLIYDCTLPSEEQGSWRFKDFTRDPKKMNQLFEKFIFNFYKVEQSDFNVRVEQIAWDLESDSVADFAYLPSMKTDITLESPDKKIIIDAKFYKETLTSYHDAEKIHSGNLYQVFSYLLNQRGESPRNQSATGILLYPTIDRELDLDYKYGSHSIQIRTVNLGAEWQTIDVRLRRIAGVS